MTPQAKVLDVGCGYGPIGLAAAWIAAQGHVTMLDINERAISLARRNAEHNRIANVTIVQSDLLAAVKGQFFRCGAYESSDSCRKRDGASHIRAGA